MRRGGTLTLVLDRAELGPEPVHAAAVLGDGPCLVLDAMAWHVLDRTPAIGATLHVPERVIRRPEAIAGWSDALLEAWWAHARLDHDGWDLMRFVGVRHVRWARRLASVAVPLLEAIDRWRPARLRLLQPPGGDALDGGEGPGGGGALAGLAADLARGRGLDVAHEPAGPAEAGPPPDDGRGEPSRPPAANDAWAPGHVLLVGDGPERARHRGLVRRLRDEGDRAVLEVRRTAAAASTPAAADGVASVVDYAGPRPRVEPAGAEAARARLLDAVARLPAGHPGRVLAGPGLRPHVARLFGSYAAALAGNLTRWRAAIIARRPGAVVAGHPEIPLEVAARLGVPAVLLPHGTIMPDEVAYHRCLPPAVRIGATGPRQRDVLRAAGIAASRIRVTGVPGAEPLDPRPPAAPAARSAAPGAAAGAAPSLRILVPTAETWRPAAKGGGTAPSFLGERRALGRLADAAAEHGWTLRVRRHPRFDRDPAFYEAASARASVAFDESPSLAAAVHAADVVVVLGAPSSAILESIAIGRPVLLLAGPRRTGAWRRLGLDRLPHAADVTGLLDRLRELAADPAARAAAMSTCRRVLPSLLAPDAEAAAARLVLDAAAADTEPGNDQRRESVPGRSGSGHDVPPARAA